MFSRVVRRHLRHGRAQSLVIVHLEDMDLALFASSLRYVGERKLMGQGVDDAALRWRQCGGEGHAVTFRRLLEQQQLRVKLENLRVVEIDI